MSDYLDANNEELLKDFFSEAEQQVEKLESNILVIENDPANHESIDEIFRAAHTLKGGSATVEMHELSGFTHIVEDLLDEIRSDKVPITEDVVNALLSSIDIIKAMLETRANGSIYSNDVEPMKNTLKSFLPKKGSASGASKKKLPPQMPTLAKPQNSASPSVTAPQNDDSLKPILEQLSEYDLMELKEACPTGSKLWSVSVVFDESNPMNSVGGIQVFAALKDRGSVLKTIPDFEVLYEDTFHSQVIYFIATTETAENLEDAAFLDDVTLSVDAQNLQGHTIPSPLEKKIPHSSPKIEQPAQEEISTETASDTTTDEDTVAIAPTAAPLKKISSPANTGGSVLRVDSKRIDYLLNLVSETVIAKASFNQTSTHISELQLQLQSIESEYKDRIRKLFDQIPALYDQLSNGKTVKEIKTDIVNEYGSLLLGFDSFETDFKGIAAKFRAATQNLGRIAGELQEGVMKIRMVPINQIFSRFPRVVRDLSRDLDKKINLVIEGEETELDKSVIEDLLDPIMHCVRNSLDHGIEKPDIRREAGKNEVGTVLLKASNEGNMIVIDIIDDGKGIDVERVRSKGIARGLIHENKTLTDNECFQLIFEAGFSTAEKITSVSGRGVGLDVVKTQIEKLNGSVMVTSKRGEGSKFSIRLPLTLAIIQGLLVRVGTEVYSIPIASVLESHRIKPEEINTIDNYEVLNIRNEVISVIRLGRVFGLKTIEDATHNFIVIVGTADKKIGVMVDALIGEEDVVIKPLSDQFTSSAGIAGASILGDGSVSLIIDVGQLLELGIKQEIIMRQEQDYDHGKGA